MLPPQYIIYKGIKSHWLYQLLASDLVPQQE